MGTACLSHILQGRVIALFVLTYHELKQLLFVGVWRGEGNE